MKGQDAISKMEKMKTEHLKSILERGYIRLSDIKLLYEMERFIEKLKIPVWIHCSKRLPKEKINPITQDYYEYPVTAAFGEVKDIRYYKFGNGHWWHGPGIMDEHVIAWAPLPDVYEEV